MYSGLSIAGPALFASVDIEKEQNATFYMVAESFLERIAARPHPPSLDVLFAMFGEWSCPELDLRLGTPGIVEVKAGRNGAGLRATCIIPFTGDADWLFYSARTWPPMQPVRGFVARSTRRDSLDTLILAVDLDHDYKAWAGVALQAELARVRHNLSLLALMPERINDGFYIRAQYLASHMQRVWTTRSHRDHRAFTTRKPVL